MKVDSKAIFSGKKTVKIEIRLISKAKMEECDQEDWSVSDIFGIITLCSATYHLVVGGPVSLNLATKASFGGKKTLRLVFQRKNGAVQPKSINLACLCLD